MNNEAEIKQKFYDIHPNTISIECDITQKDVFPLGKISIKEESIEYANAEQKISSNATTFVQNIDSKAELLEIEDCKITYNLDTQNFGDDFQSFIHHQLKSENDEMHISLPKQEVYDEGTVNNKKIYCSNSAFKFVSNDVPSNTIPTEYNIVRKDIFPLTEINSRCESLKIEDSKISYNLDSRNGDQSFVDRQFKSENGKMDCTLPGAEIFHKEAVKNEKIYCPKCAFKFGAEVISPFHFQTQHIVDTGNLCGCESQYKPSIERQMKIEHMIDIEYKTKPVEGYTRKTEMFKCNLCEYESKRRSDMVKHVKKVHKEHKCPRCIYKTNCKSELKEHLSTHGVSENTDFKKFIRTAENLYKCKLCEYECRHRSGIYRHILIKHDKTNVKEHKCSQCEYRTYDSTVMKRHILIHDDIKPYECDVCNKRFRRNHHLKGHSAMHSGEKRFQCSYCDYKNNYKSSMKIHMKNKHITLKNKDYKCTQCPYETNFKPHLTRHVKRHLLGGDKEFKCTQCSYNTNFKSDLNMHVQNKHKEVKEYKCKQCKYKTNYKVNIKQHILNHDNVKLYECNICNKLFKWKVSLKKHIRCIHLNEKNFHCAHCDYKTNYKSHLVVHINNKHVTAQDKKYKCGKCNYESDSHQCFERHLKNHIVKRNYVCNKQFKEKGQLRLRIQGMHFSEKKYNCKECNYKTNFKRVFTGHILTNHSS